MTKRVIVATGVVFAVPALALMPLPGASALSPQPASHQVCPTTGPTTGPTHGPGPTAGPTAGPCPSPTTGPTTGPGNRLNAGIRLDIDGPVSLDEVDVYTVTPTTNVLASYKVTVKLPAHGKLKGKPKFRGLDCSKVVNREFTCSTAKPLQGDQPGTFEFIATKPGSVITKVSIEARTKDGQTDSWSTIADAWIPVGYVRGVIYEDLNSNGARDSGEPGIPNVRVALTGRPESSAPRPADFTRTGADGTYAFEDVVPAAADAYLLYTAPPNKSWAWSAAGADQNFTTVWDGEPAGVQKWFPTRQIRFGTTAVTAAAASQVNAGFVRSAR